MDVNRAWEKLHMRLVEEQLLDPTAKTVAMPFITKVKWAAALVVLCVCSGAIGLFYNAKTESEPFFSIHNSDISNTLVKTLNDGSIVYLAGGATLTCPEQFAADMRYVGLNGEALFDVQTVADYPFFIETDPVVIEVLGTKFVIKSTDKNLFELSVQHGLVKATLKATGAHIFVEAGETVRLNERQQLLKEPSTDSRQFAHYAEKMRFKDERLENIVHVISKMSDKSIGFSDHALKNRELTIAFINNTVEEMIALLCMVLEVKYIDDGEGYVIGGSEL